MSSWIYEDFDKALVWFKATTLKNCPKRVGALSGHKKAFNRRLGMPYQLEKTNRRMHISIAKAGRKWQKMKKN